MSTWDTYLHFMHCLQRTLTKQTYDLTASGPGMLLKGISTRPHI